MGGVYIINMLYIYIGDHLFYSIAWYMQRKVVMQRFMLGLVKGSTKTHILWANLNAITWQSEGEGWGGGVEKDLVIYYISCLLKFGQEAQFFIYKCITRWKN